MSPPVAATLLIFGCAISACQKEAASDRPSKEPSFAEAKSQEAPPEQPADPPAAIAEPEAPPEPVAAPKRRYVVAALGDSITDAKNGGGGFLEVLRKACPKSVFHNFGKGGDMTNQMRRRLENEIAPQLASLKVDTLLVYGGVNDLYSDLTANRKNDKIEEDLTRIYQFAQSKNLEVVAVTVSPWGGFRKYFNERRGQNTKLLNSWILGQVATGLVDKAVDSFAPLSCGNPNDLCPDYETRFHDGIHLGEKGHRILGEKLAQEAFGDCL